MSQPAYPGALPVAEVAAGLAEATQHPSHQFWPDAISLLEPGVMGWQRVLDHRQVTDNYLLALALHYEGRFVTFDARLDAAAVPGSTAAHRVVLK